MNNILDTIFHSADECKENGHTCKMDKKDINYIYKPDKGIKDLSIINKIFNGKHQPKLSDCIIIYNENKLAIIEIKCGRVTKRLIDETIEKITNVYKVLNSKELKTTKLILLYKSLENAKLRQVLQSKEIFGKRIIEKKYSNQAIRIN